MKISRIIMMVALLLLVPVFALSSELGYMRISLIKGDVQLKTPEAEEWGFATINTPLAEGDQVWVPEGGIAELQLNGGTYLRLDQNSSLQVLSMDADSSQFYLSQGRTYIFYDGPRGSLIQIDTADSSTRAFSRSVFKIDVADQYTDVAVLKGYVETENNAGSTRINAGRLLSLGKDTEGEFAPLDSPDSWERWNRKRDARVIVSNEGGASFLPAELKTYSSDLDRNGRWEYVPEYGNVWTPTVTAGSDWSPYRQGRWFLRNGESVWVADEPWGWAPYHFGRWSFVASIGWCWVPPAAGEVHWGPGYVGWVRTADYVAWVPLAPGEIYYGRGNYGRHSVNIATVNINQVRVVNVYRNVQVNNGVTIVKRNTFNTASPSFVRADREVIRKKIFVTNNINIGAPDIRPSRGAHYPSARSIPSNKLPPLRIRNLQPKEIKHERPLVREHDRSVLAPGSQPRSLPVNRVDTPRTPGKDRPALRQIQPREQKRPEASPGSIPRGEQQTVRPSERRNGGVLGSPAPRGDQPLVKPADQRKPETFPGAFPRGERPQVRPLEQGKPASVPGSYMRGEQPQSRPEERRGAGVPVGPAPKGDQPLVKPADQRKPETFPGAFPRGERPQVRPLEQGKPASVPGSYMRGEQPQSRPQERRGTGVPSTPAPKVDQPLVKPADQRKPETFPGAFPRGERPQVRPPEQGKPASVPGSYTRGEQPQSRPQERRGAGVPSTPTPKGDQPLVKPADQRKPETFPGAFPRGERPQVRPIDQGKPASVPGSYMRGEQPQSRPQERRGVGVPSTPTPKGDQPLVKPAVQRKPEASPSAEPPRVQPGEKLKPEALPGRVRRGEQQQDKPVEKRKDGATGGHAPKNEKDAPKSDDDASKRR